MCIRDRHASVIKSKLEDYLERTTDDDFVDEISPVSIESVELKNIVDGEVVDISESCDKDVYKRQISYHKQYLLAHMFLDQQHCISMGSFHLFHALHINQL